MSDRFDRARELRASAAELAEPCAAVRAEVRSHMRQLELARTWLEDGSGIFGSMGELGHPNSEQHAADDPED